MNENPECKLCQLHETAHEKSVCLKGRGERDSSLVIFLDAPGIIEDKRHKSFVSEGVEYLDFLMSKMSVSKEQYYLDYVLKCYPKPCREYGRKAPRQEMLEACSVYTIATLQLLKPKAVVLMGPTACEAAMGSAEIKNYEGARWIPSPLFRNFVEAVWITYNPAYGIQDPAETVGIYRTLFNAALEADLKPKWNKQPKFDYGL